MTLEISKKLTIKKVYWLRLLGIASIQAFSVNPCFAQSSNIIADDSLGNEASQIEKNSQLKGLTVEIIRGGAQRGINLFHSFREFNVSEGRGAYFFSPNAEIQNILTRVTGNNRSEILGTLGTFGNSQPNLFLINPNGILFGENASLDVEGSFVGTTANGVQFGERGVFSATNPETPALLTVNPSALFFNQINAQASIQTNSVAEAGIDPVGIEAFGLRVPNGKSLLLLGGDVSINYGDLNAYGGRVELGGLVEPGTVALDINGDIFRLGFPKNVKRGDVSLTNEGSIFVEADDGGDIVVYAQNLEMTGESYLYAGIATGLGSDNSKAGNIDINATGIVNVNNSYIGNDVEAEARGQGGDVNINANTLQVEDGAQVGPGTFGKGKSGNLTINAQDVQLIGGSKDGEFPTGLFASAQPGSTGDSGNLTLSTNKLLVQDGAVVSTTTFGEGKGGDLTVNAQDVKLIGESGLFAPALPGSKGDAGNLTLSTNKLLVQDGALVSAATYGEGKGGNLTVNAQDVQLIGESWLFASAAESGSTGDSGNLTLSTNKLLVQDGGGLSTVTYGEGKGGDLTVNAQDVKLIGESGLFASAEPGSKGDAGNLTLSTNTFLVQDGAEVSTATFGEGKGGDLTVNTKTLQLKNDAAITTQSSSLNIAGNIEINVKDSFNADNGQVITESRQSSGGNIKITAGKNIFLRNNSDIKTILSTTDRSGGDITLKANAIVALEDSDILTFAPEGSGGNINFNTRAFFSNPLYGSTSQTANKETLDALDSNNRVDINASGSISTGNIIGIPDISFLQDNLTDLPANQIDTNALIANSCIARSTKRQENSFTITGSGGLRNSPVDGFVSKFSTGDVRNVGQISRNWKKGDPIVEPTGVYQLPDGRLLLSRICEK